MTTAVDLNPAISKIRRPSAQAEALRKTAKIPDKASQAEFEKVRNLAQNHRVAARAFSINQLLELRKTGGFTNEYIFQALDEKFQIINKGDKEAARDGYFACIPFRTHFTYELLKFLVRHRTIMGGHPEYTASMRATSFLDIGCGNGAQLLTARVAGFQKVSGIELSKKSAKVAQSLLHDEVSGKVKSVPPCPWGEFDYNIIQGDAFELGPVISDHEYCFMYSPISNGDLMCLLGNHVINNLKVGACLIEVRPVWLTEFLYRFTSIRELGIAVGGVNTGRPVVITKLSETEINISYIGGNIREGTIQITPFANCSVNNNNMSHTEFRNKIGY